MKRVIVKTCPKTGKQFQVVQRNWPTLLLPITGLFALVWFLVRVIPKPSRATYPCQRMAVPLASAFVVWIMGLVGSTIAYRRAKFMLDRSRYMLAAICAVAAVAIVWTAISATENNPVAAAFAPSEPANSPMGVAKGINPGRVVWVHDANATSWDGSTGNWWDDKNTDPKIVDAMVSSALKGLAGKSSDSQAWDALFRYFNKTKGLGDAGYQKPEKIVVKLNMNQERGSDWKPDAGMPSPQVVYALVHQLIKVAGVPGSAITIYDASRYVGDPIYKRIRGNADPDFQAVAFVVAPKNAKDGRIAAVPDTASPLKTKAGTAYLPTCVTEAKYMINLALLRAHTLCGVTLCAKNHFGTTYFEKGGWTPQPLHDTSSRKNPMGSYNCLVDLNGHKQTGGKTLLYMIDGLYPAKNQTAPVIRFASFGNDWFSSILASQDLVAIDSVGLDFLRSEQAVNPVMVDVVGNPDNYLHEAALANKPPSGTAYDPEGDGTTLESLGVHEHWNNAKDRKYSRNLGTGNGIELVQAH
ncbi:MAG: DUF362 domain-containing protein [Phycisphaerae bacterium]|nr:DUF362 domain-containing protein [Phycisphaerae bacterium]